eukprot:scaffold99413_cov65-Phaeocystis_antarctica.AAC.1
MAIRAAIGTARSPVMVERVPEAATGGRYSQEAGRGTWARGGGARNPLSKHPPRTSALVRGVWGNGADRPRLFSSVHTPQISTRKRPLPAAALRACLAASSRSLPRRLRRAGASGSVHAHTPHTRGQRRAWPRFTPGAGAGGSGEGVGAGAAMCSVCAQGACGLCACRTGPGHTQGMAGRVQVAGGAVLRRVRGGVEGVKCTE